MKSKPFHFTMDRHVWRQQRPGDAPLDMEDGERFAARRVEHVSKFAGNDEVCSVDVFGMANRNVLLTDRARYRSRNAVGLYQHLQSQGIPF